MWIICFFGGFRFYLKNWFVTMHNCVICHVTMIFWNIKFQCFFNVNKNKKPLKQQNRFNCQIPNTRIYNRPGLLRIFILQKWWLKKMYIEMNMDRSGQDFLNCTSIVSHTCLILITTKAFAPFIASTIRKTYQREILIQERRLDYWYGSCGGGISGGPLKPQKNLILNVFT